MYPSNRALLLTQCMKGNNVKKLITAAALAVATSALVACGSSPDLDAPIGEQMEAVGAIDKGLNVPESSYWKVADAMCNARDNNLSHGWVVDSVVLEMQGDLTPSQAEKYVNVLYANACPEYS